jgi:16S rRNA (guanine527-N7)-methyltransferase
VRPAGLAADIARVLGRELASPAIDRIYKYLELLAMWQKATRLVGSTDVQWMVDNLVLDSLLFTKVLPKGASRVLDFGSGAGVPGIPLAISLPEIEVTLVESRRKRASFLAQAVRELQLSRARVLHDRLTEEHLPAELLSAFDAVVMRCSGEFLSVLPIVMRLVTPAGSVIASGAPEDEPAPHGRWVEVPGVTPGSTRRFMVAVRDVSELSGEGE